MKIIMAVIATLVFAAQDGCGDKKAAATCFKGKLEVKGICSNYTIKVLEGDASNWVQKSWTDEETGKKHTNVFKLGNPCNFPDMLKEGDTFYFTLDTTKQEGCNTCMAYYPTPEKTAAIKVMRGPCN